MLSFEDFARLAKDKSLESFEKVGFGAVHRAEKEQFIFPDIKNKLLAEENVEIIVDIGCGCSRPVLDLIDFCKIEKDKVKELVLVDSKEMLDNIKDETFMKKYAIKFPDKDFVKLYKNKVDVIIIYSVLHHICFHQNFIEFLDSAVALLKEGGRLFIGDIPNVSKKKRFLHSQFGREFHKKFSGEYPDNINCIDFHEKQLYDDLIFMILQRYRLMGFETYLLPQTEKLPLCYTREDILIRKW
jgi:2-polyprenyl-3-methyl-5-hydroxy-6-metoxy-1,4-benzoquinol methylase